MPRSYEDRVRDTLTMLKTPRVDGWISTGAPSPYVVPLRIAWHHDAVLVAVSPNWPAAKHLETDPRVRIGVGRSDDCVVIDARVLDHHTTPVMRATHPDAYAAYIEQAGIEPADDVLFYVFRPRRIQAWRGDHELPDRTLMHDGSWLVQIVRPED